MNYIKKDLGAFNLHLIKTEKFKTITVKVSFRSPIIKEDITKRVLLSDILIQSSKEYESKRDLTIKSEELYAASLATTNERLGNYIQTSFNFQVLNDKYTEEGNFNESLRFLHQIIFCPDIVDNKFKKDKLDIVKNNLMVSLKSFKENASKYSLLRLFENYDSNSPVSYCMSGYLNDLDLINEENLYEYYKNMISNDFVDIFIVGDFNEDLMLSLVKEYFKFRKIKKQKISYYLECKKPRKKELVCKEEISYSQSKLDILCVLSNLTEYEKNYPLVLAGLIFGGGTDSKLFKEVREKNSLCYTIHSFSNKLDNTLVVAAGIDKDNYENTVSLVKKILLDLKKGKFSDKDISIAKEIYNTSLEEIEESEFRIINEYLLREIFNYDSIENRINKMNKVKKSEILKVFKKIDIDTIFLLEGVKHEED